MVPYTLHIVSLKFSDVPYLEFWAPLKENESFLDDSITFPRTAKSEDDLVPYLVKELFFWKGDHVSYLNILMKYCKSVAVINKQKAEDAISTTTSKQSVVRSALMKELSTERTKSFANMVDADYKQEMVDVYSDWIEPRSFLLAPSKMNVYYEYLMKKCCHLM